MSAVTLRKTEGMPDAWPEVVVSTAAEPYVTAAWVRIESYIAHRWAPRAVEFIAEGPGCWTPALTPFALETIERWDGASWAETEPALSPMGYELGDGTYRISGVAGDSDADVPALAIEAVKRLAEFMATPPGRPGASSEAVTAGSVTISTTRSPSWMAKAIDNSGAADLLRNFRRA